MKKHITLFFLSIYIILIHCAQAAAGDSTFSSLIPKLTEVEKLVYSSEHSDAQSLFVHPLHERNVPRLRKEVCSSCYSEFCMTGLGVIKNKIEKLKKQYAALHVDVLNTESAISKLRELSTRLSNNYKMAFDELSSPAKIIDNKLAMELMCCAAESPTEVLTIINKYVMLITVAKKTDDFFQNITSVERATSKDCCDGVFKLSIPQQDIITCAQFCGVRPYILVSPHRSGSDEICFNFPCKRDMVMVNYRRLLPRR